METKGPQPDHVYTVMTLPFVGGVVRGFTIAREDATNLNDRVLHLMVEAMEKFNSEPPLVSVLACDVLTDPEHIRTALDLAGERVPESATERAEMKSFHYAVWVELEEIPGAENASTMRR